MKRRAVGIAVALALVGLALVEVDVARSLSTTIDEPAHVAGGMAALAHREHAFSREHPPLARVLAAARKVGGEKTPLLANSENNLAFVLIGLGRTDEALAHLRSSLANYEATLGPEHATLKRNFDVNKSLVALAAGGGQRGDQAVAERYHAGLVAPYCVALIREFFERAGR